MNQFCYVDRFGRPPFAPLARAAAALASDFTLPPRRPKATAAGFLRGTVGLHTIEPLRCVDAMACLRPRFVRLAALDSLAVPQLMDGVGYGRLAGHKETAGLGVSHHVRIVTKRLGSVNGVKWA